jgi:MFS family permease
VVKRPAAALAVLSAAVFLSGLDQTVVVTILPQIALDLRLPFTQLDEAAWIVTAYLLGYAAAMPLLGRVADVHGVLPVFLVSAALFAAGSWWAALADGLWSLVAARTVQAAGGGGMVPVALAVAAAVPAVRTRLLALGVVAGAAEAGAVLGPLYGGAFLELAGWRAVFWVNLPLTALLAAGAFLLLPRGRPAEAEPVDWLGGLLAGLALLALTVGISSASLGLPVWGRVAAFLAAALLAAAYAAAPASPHRCCRPGSTGGRPSRPPTRRTCSSERRSSSRSSRSRSLRRPCSTARPRRAAFCCSA